MSTCHDEAPEDACPVWEIPEPGTCCDVYLSQEGCPCPDGTLTDEPYTCGHGIRYPRGRCQTGWTQCEDGLWGACEGEQRPMRERPNGLDDDCDGLDDDGLCPAEQSCGGHCCTDAELCFGARCGAPVPCDDASGCENDDTHCVDGACALWADGDLDPACAAANLTVRAAWSLDECTAERVVLRALVANRGAAAAPAGVVVAFTINDSLADGAGIACEAQTAAGLGPGEATEVSCEWLEPPADVFIHAVVLQVDPGGVVTECLETDNGSFLVTSLCDALYHPESL